MNKYEEALQQIVPTYVGMTNVANDKLCEQFQNEYYVFRKVLQELVDKTIPKKPIKLEYKILLENGWSYECPICKCAIGINTKAIDYTQEEGYCPTCGQALDWSNNED